MICSMASLLAKFRIDYSDLKVIPDITKKPRESSVSFFESLISEFKETEGTDGESSAHESKTCSIYFETCVWFFFFYIWVSVHHKSIIYRVSQEDRTKLREGVPYVKLYWYNPKHLCPKLNGFRDNDKWCLKLWQLLNTYWLPNSY